MAKQALAAQLNIDNAFQTGAQNKEPIDLVDEAVKLLQGDAPYTIPAAAAMWTPTMTACLARREADRPRRSSSWKLVAAAQPVMV
jgi:hypothetical protein